MKSLQPFITLIRLRGQKVLFLPVLYMDGKLNIFRNLLKRPCDENPEITKLLGEKQGRALLIGQKLDDQQCTVSASTLHGWKVKYFQELTKKTM